MGIKRRLAAWIPALIFSAAATASGLEHKIEAVNTGSGTGIVQTMPYVNGLYIVVDTTKSDTKVDTTKAEPDTASAGKRLTWELINDLLPEAQERDGLIGRANEDSLYNKSLKIGDLEIVFADYRDLNPENVVQLSPEQERVISRIYAPHIGLGRLLFGGGTDSTKLMFSEKTKQELIAGLPGDFQFQTFDRALLHYAGVLAKMFTYKLDTAIQRDTMGVEEIWNSGDGVCRHYTPLFLAMFNSTKHLSPNLNKFSAGVSNTPYTRHSANILAARSRANPNRIYITLVDPTWYDTRIEQPANDGEESRQTPEDVFGAYDKAHANDFALVQPFIDNTRLLGDWNLEREVVRVSREFYLKVFRECGPGDANYFLAGSYVFKELAIDEQIAFLESFVKGDGLGDNASLKYHALQLRFKRGDFGDDEFLEHVITGAFGYEKAAMSELVDAWYKKGEYEKITWVPMDVFDIRELRTSDHSMMGSADFNIITLIGGGTLIVDNDPPDLGKYVSALHQLYLQHSPDVSKQRVIDAYRGVYDKTIGIIQQGTFKWGSRSHKRSFESIGRYLDRGKIPNIKDLNRLYIDY